VAECCDEGAVYRSYRSAGHQIIPISNNNINKKTNMSTLHNLQVIDKKMLTPESVSVVLEIPEDLKSKYNFKPGQFVMVEKIINGENLRRYYSIYNLPEDAQIKLGIKLKGKDGFADFAMHHLQHGDTLQVSEPMDDVPFDLSDHSSKRILAITIGSGITPFYSYIQYMLKRQLPHKLVLIYGNESPAKTMFLDEISELEAQFPQHLKVYKVYSKDDSGDFSGRINEQIIKNVLQKEGTGFDAIYMIGPDDLKKTAAKVLTEAGTTSDKLHYRVYS